MYLYMSVYFYGHCNHFVSKKKPISMTPKIVFMEIHGLNIWWPGFERWFKQWNQWKRWFESKWSNENLSGVFNYVTMFNLYPDPCGNDAIWLSYFSDGLKTPSRKFSRKRVRIQGANGIPPMAGWKTYQFFLLEMHRLKWLFFHSHTIVLYGIFTYILPWKSTIHVGKYSSHMDAMRLTC